MSETKLHFTGDEVVARVLDEYPYLEDAFVEFGFKNILNPIMRKTIARRVTLKMACGMKGVELNTFVSTLSERVAEKQGEQQ